MGVSVEVFTDEEYEYILNNFLHKKINEMAEHLSIDTVRFSKKIDLVIVAGKFISEEYAGKSLREIKTLERHRMCRDLENNSLTLKELAEYLGCVQSTAQKIALAERYRCKDKKKALEVGFTDDQIQFMKDNIIYLSNEQLAEKIGMTNYQVQYKLKELIDNGEFISERYKGKSVIQIRHAIRLEMCSEMEDEQYNSKELAEKLGCSYTVALKCAEKTGLKLRRKALPKKEREKLFNQFEKILTDEIDLEFMTLEEWFRRWFHTYRDNGIREVTRIFYKDTWVVLQKSDLGKMRLIDINRSHVQAYVNEYGENRSKSTVLDHIQLVRSCFGDAVLDGHIRVNSAGNVRLVYKEQRLSIVQQKELRDVKKWLEVDEYNAFKDELLSRLQKLLNGPIKTMSKTNRGTPKGVPYQTHLVILFLALKTGARFSEIMGITRDDVIAEKPYRINIDKTWNHKRIGEETFISTKNMASIRQVNVDKETIDILIAYMDWLDRNELIAEENTLFNLENRNVFNAEVNTTLRSILTHLDIQPITIHKLRHTMASYLIAKGVDLMVVAKRLGHTDTSMVMKVYGHLLKETEDEHNKKIMQLI